MSDKHIVVHIRENPVEAMCGKPLIGRHWDYIWQVLDGDKLWKNRYCADCAEGVVIPA